MKKLSIILFVLFTSVNIFSQDNIDYQYKVKVGDKYEYYADGFTSINTESHRGWQKSANK